MARGKFNFEKWCDEFLLAAKGIWLSFMEPRFWCGFVPTYIVFGMLMNLLSSGTTKFELMAATGFSGALQIIGSAFLSVVGINQIFADWILIFLIALLQGILVGLIVLLWQKKRANSENIESAGIITGLVALGAGCPTCGTTLLTPLLGAIFSTGSLAAASVISGIVTVVAIVVAILSLKRLGVEAYVMLVNEKFLERKSTPGVEKTSKKPSGKAKAKTVAQEKVQIDTGPPEENSKSVPKTSKTPKNSKKKGRNEKNHQSS